MKIDITTMLKAFATLALMGLCNLSHAALQIHSWTMPNGARVVFVESRTLPILDVSVDFDAGSRRDPEGKSGLAAMTNAMLARGLREAATPTGIEPAMTEAQISDDLANIAAEPSARLDDDRAGLGMRTLVSERDAAVNLLARLLVQPSFPDDVLTRDKARTIAGIRESLTRPAAIADRAFGQMLYGTHPYADQPDVASIEAIKRDDLQQFHAAHYVANRAVIAMIGDITRTQAEHIAQQLTERLPQGAPLPQIPPVQIVQGQERRIPHPASQTHIMIGMPAYARHDPDHFALTVGNYVLGGGSFVSRLTKEVREKRGLTYGIYSSFEPMEQAGPFRISVQTQKRQAEQALALVRKTIGDFLNDGPTASEVAAAKANLVGGFALRIDSNRKILENIAAIGFYRLPLDYLDTWAANIEKVTPAQVKDAFNRKIQADKLSTVIVGGE